MSIDPSTAAPVVQEPPAVTSPVATPEAPPWGEDFDAEKAWNLIQNLRSDKEKLAARPVLTDVQKGALAEHDRLVQASKTEAERLQEATAAAQRDAETARAETLRYKAAATYGVPAEHFDLLGSGTEEEISARAQKISAMLAGQAPAVTPPISAPSTRPVAQLRPGATPSGTESEDDVLYAQLFGAK